MSTPADIVEEHRQDLIRRLISRNPLLHFRPSRSRIDFFALHESSKPKDTKDSQSGILTSQEDVETKISESAETVFQRLISGNSVSLTLASRNKFVTPLTRLKKDAVDTHRHRGHWPLVFAWPLLHLPRGGGLHPYCAPLLFWKINVEIVGHRVTISLREPDAEFNFILQARLEKDENLRLQWNHENEDSKLGLLEREIRDTLFPYSVCQIPDGFGAGNYVHQYPDEIEPVSQLLPCAIIGSANFSYRPLLEELKKIKDALDEDKPHGLLSELLTETKNSGQSTFAPEPAPIDRWLVEESDARQEASVWQARQERTMLIQGPPGTGKSQTIVNLITDAVQRGERVALVCQKKPALDVVRKRLSGIGLGNLVAQVNEPLQEHGGFIKRIKGIESAGSSLFDAANKKDREKLCKQIAESEHACRSLPDDEELPYSVRGHLRAEMFRINKETGFQVFDPEYKEILSAFKSLGLPVHQNETEQLTYEAAQFAENWQKCDYNRSPWREISDGLDVGKMPTLAEGCKKLRQDFLNVAQQGGNLPSKSLLVVAENPIIGRHFHSFVSDAKQNATCDLCNLIAKTKRLFTDVEIPALPLWGELFNGGVDGNPFDKHDDIQIIWDVRRQLQENPALRLLSDKFPGRVSDWENIFTAIISKLCWDAKPFNLHAYEKNIDTLKSAVPQKTKADRESILAKFPERKKHAIELQRRELLHIKKSRSRKREGRPTPLHKLYHQNSNQIWGIYPILLTNPNAMCQMTPLQAESIDTIIIDEASQMFTADALPLFYRAKKIIISGDAMQMPPSDFFTDSRDYNDDGDEDKDEIASPEKGKAPAQGRFELLDAMEHLLLFRGEAAHCKLNVHYRSRPSELIAFSNHAFYGGKLQAAPDNATLPECMNRPIEVERVTGLCESGVNRQEIDAVIKRLYKIWEATNALSIGVIVCNIRQANALKDAIADECERDQQFSENYEHASSDDESGIFVRSIEHVQGDERDIIVLATTYDSESKRYGPISHAEKGRRRLNVAVTRAKQGMFIITSLGDNISNPGERPDDNNKDERERWFLWQYMRYARAVSNDDGELAKRILAEINPKYVPYPTGREPDSEFEIQVADFLRGHGYHVDYQIGESGFRIDLGVKQNKEDPLYLCGVECDGRPWHDGWGARHRDISRQDILERKGWKIFRIWSDEWFGRSDGGEKLLGEIERHAKLTEEA